MLHQSLLEGLAPTTDRCMPVFFARHWVLHRHLFVNGCVEENGTIRKNCLLHCSIDPTWHVMAWIGRTVARGMNDLRQNSKFFYPACVETLLAHLLGEKLG